MRLATNEFLPLKNVKIDDGFWGKYQKTAIEQIIPYQWRAINDLVPDAEPSHAIKNLRVAAGLEEGEFGGYVFQDSDVYKWLEAAAYRLTIAPDPELEKTADGVIELMEKAQEDDGYLMTYFQIKEPDKKFTNLLDCHELYCAGHMVEAAVAYREATGKDRLLNIALRFVALIESKIGPEEGKLHGYPGHPELELALMRLYAITGDERHKKLCEYMINARGTEPHFFDGELKRRKGINMWGGYQERVDKRYNQSHKPIREQTVAVGHSVRAGYLFTGAAALAAENGDESLKKAMEVLWNDITLKQMYITGGVGAQVHGEAFSFDYHLPNDSAYNETCAAIAMVFFARQMLRMEPSGRYADVMERLIYNATISGMSLDGRHFFYTNPLSMWEEATKKAGICGHIRSKRPGWFGCACCPPNLARMITSLGSYIYSVGGDTLYTHLYVGSEAEADLPCGKVRIAQKGNYPWDGKISLRLSGGRYALALRIPSWARGFKLKVNGLAARPEMKDGYAVIRREWHDDDSVTLDMPMPVEFIEANPLAREDNGRVALMRGPVVYCFESADNGDRLDALRVADFSSFAAERDDSLFEGAVVLRGKALRRLPWESGELYRPVGADAEEEAAVTAIPYAFWDNRDDTREMLVWIRK